MYGGTRAPSLLPKYETNYIVLKEAVRQVLLDGFGIHLFDIKKAVFPLVPFYTGSYKFNKVKRKKNVYSMDALSKWLKGKTFGAKGSSSNNPKPHEGDEEAAKKYQDESTERSGRSC